MIFSGRRLLQVLLTALLLFIALILLGFGGLVLVFWLDARIQPSDLPIVRAFVERTHNAPPDSPFSHQNLDAYVGLPRTDLEAAITTAGFLCSTDGTVCNRWWPTFSGPCFWALDADYDGQYAVRSLTGRWEGNCYVR